MGTENSHSKDEDNNLINDKTEDLSIQWNEISSYKGMKSDTSSTKNNKNPKKKKINESSSSMSSSSETKTKTKEETTISKKDERVPFKFEWKEGGNKVTITGSFLSNWTVFIEMVKNPENGFFEFNINLPKEVHQFKFVVDNIWKCSNNYPVSNDGHGNINNVIDLTNFIPPEEVDKKNNNEKNDNKKSDKEKKKSKSKNEYDCYVPNKNEMNIDAPFIPPHYINFYDIDYNTRQNLIGKKKYLHFVEKDILSENSCYKNILSCPHVNLNHCCNCCKVGNEDKYVRSSSSQRYKHKLLTIIYYKPKMNCENDS